jgi:hypothetical protein
MLQNMHILGDSLVMGISSDCAHFWREALEIFLGAIFYGFTALEF